MVNEYRGSCLCRSIQYTLTGEPFTFYVCHCNNCRKSSGSAFLANAFFKKDQVCITKGSEHVKVYRDTDTSSGKPLIRSFCPTCSACLFLGGEGVTYTIVAVGTVEDDFDWVPRGEKFVQCRKQWVEGIKTKPKPQSKL